MSSAEEPHDSAVRIYPPVEAMKRARPLPPRESLVIRDVPDEDWLAFQEALAGK